MPFLCCYITVQLVDCEERFMWFGRSEYRFLVGEESNKIRKALEETASLKGWAESFVVSLRGV